MLLSSIPRRLFQKNLKLLDDINKLMITRVKIDTSKHFMKCTKNKVTMVLYVDELRLDMTKNVKGFMDQAIKKYISVGHSVRDVNIIVSQEKLEEIQEVFDRFCTKSNIKVLEEMDGKVEILMRMKIFYELVGFYNVDLSTPQLQVVHN